jgi:hypothetical protein
VAGLKYPIASAGKRAIFRRLKSEPLRLLLLALCAIAAIRSARAEDSLFDAATSRSLSPALQSRFGPESAQRHYDTRMIRAAEIATKRAYAQPTWRCWHYVKDALVDAQVIPSRPVTAWAKQAGQELMRRYGFEKLNVRTPLEAPVGAVIVYGGADAGHVEIRTAKGFVSDFTSRTPYPRPFLGAYVKPV